MAERDRRPVDQIARLQRRARVIGRDPGAEFLNPPDAFVSQDDGKGHHARFARQDVDVAATDPAEHDGDERAARFRIDDRHIPGLKLVRLDQYGSAALHLFSP